MCYKEGVNLSTCSGIIDSGVTDKNKVKLVLSPVEDNPFQLKNFTHNDYFINFVILVPLCFFICMKS